MPIERPYSDLRPHVVFQIDEGSGNWRTIPCTQYMTNFTYQISSESGGGNGSVSFFDPDWDYLEPIFLNARKNDGGVRVSFGWAHIMSPMVECTLENMTPQISSTGVNLNVTFIQSELGDTEPAFYSAPEGSRISDVVAELARQKGWQTEIEQTAQVGYKTPIINNGVPTFQFIKSLAEIAVTPEGVGGYMCYMDGKKLVFKPSKSSTHDIVRTYMVYHNRQGEVLNFAADDSIQLNGVLGTAEVAVRGVDPDEKARYEILVNNANNTSRHKRMGAFGYGQSSKSSPMWTDSKSIEDGLARSQARYTKLNDQSYEASLSIMGDPVLKAQQYVKVLVVKKNGRMHYLSGSYMILDLSHSISPGQFTSELKLIRDSSDLGSDDLMGTAVRFNESVRNSINEEEVEPVDGGVWGLSNE